ncbi:FRG domain-containing protein [Methanobrevibacter sp.]|uniref:FRG domain-containing protein n=1 Tax=Methanobrevibacter sp. TaxID=66852 RepID=UPI002E772094|nr:FRG domain-containing protein [Methanobrevibacter sp.]MEE0939677.1 FRG domain-containing protein [Methanobrevibacter sp.]
MHNELQKEKYDRLVAIHKITEFTDLKDIIKIDEDYDLRENYIFRGVKRLSYNLIPSSLRKDSKTQQLEINKFILKSEFNFLSKQNRLDTFFNKDYDVPTGPVDKNNMPSKITPKYQINSKEELQFKREIYVLLKFLDYADKIGLKIQADTSIRRWIHNHLAYENELKDIWPKPEFFEIISLAQHHELPTRALDWTYDFKVALYFAVSAILDGNDEDCVLWAFNYKLFEDNYNKQKYENDKLAIYRPEYSTNPNLKAQKGLFTFLTCQNYEKIDDDTPFDEELINSFSKIKSLDENQTYYQLNEFQEITIGNNEKIFHKFIISHNLKKEILKELYLDGYAHENLFPNYDGVVQSIRKRAQLDYILNFE